MKNKEEGKGFGREKKQKDVNVCVSAWDEKQKRNL